MEHRRTLLMIECAALFFVLPAALYFVRFWIAYRIVPAVLLISLLCSLALWRSPSFELKRLVSLSGMAGHGKAIIATFLLPALILTAGTWLFLEERFFAFPAARPNVWMMVFLLYPILGAFPQEVVFRAFFFHRYRPLFERPAAMVLASSASFCLAHLFYANPVAPALSFLGGLLFSWRYLRTGSLPAAALEHGLWGNFLFTVGIGWYFYSGAIQ